MLWAVCISPLGPLIRGCRDRWDMSVTHLFGHPPMGSRLMGYICGIKGELSMELVVGYWDPTC